MAIQRAARRLGANATDDARQRIVGAGSRPGPKPGGGAHQAHQANPKRILSQRPESFLK